MKGQKEIRIMRDIPVTRNWAQDDMDAQAEQYRKTHGIKSKEPVDQRQLDEMTAFIAKAKKGSVV
jgi:cbb3-type cytochrome oxidase cytochrome c subunit